MSRERDIEKADFQPELEHTDTGDSKPSSDEKIVSNKDLGISAIAVPSEVAEAIDDPPRGRKESCLSESSNDSEHTLSDHDHDHQTATPPRSLSRAVSSTTSVRKAAVKVPRSQRRGLLGRFTIIAEVTNQYDYDRRTKWFMTFTIALAGCAGPMASSIILPALVDITRDFNSTATVVNLSIALYMLSMSIWLLRTYVTFVYQPCPAYSVPSLVV